MKTDNGEKCSHDDLMYSKGTDSLRCVKCGRYCHGDFRIVRHFTCSVGDFKGCTWDDLMDNEDKEGEK